MLRISLLIAVLVLSVSGGFAETATGIKVESGTRVSPQLAVAFVSDSNFYNVRDAEESVSGTLVSPGIYLESTSRRSQLSAGLEAEAGFFDSSHRDDYVDALAYGRYQYKAGTRHKLMGGISTRDGHDGFGRRRTEGSALGDQDLDEYRENIGSLGYRYGAVSALINFELDVNFQEREYTTNRSLGTKFLDYSALEQEFTTYINVSPKTSLLFQAFHRDIDMKNIASGFADRSAVELGAFVGAEWLATQKTKGRFVLGWMERDQDSDVFEDFDALDWAFSLDWSPRVTSVFSLKTSRETEESFILNSSFIDTRSMDASWRQRWNQILGSVIAFEYRKREFEGIEREDEFYLSRLRINAQVSRGITIYGQFQYTERDSNFDVRDYDKSVLQIGFEYKQ